MNLFSNEIFVSVISTLATALIFWIFRLPQKLFLLLFRKEYKQKKNELCNRSAYNRFFYKYFKKSKVKFRYYACLSSDIKNLKLKSNYVIIGDGGVGKSSYLINDFNKISPIAYNKIFFNSEEIIKFNPVEMENKVKSVGKTILYLDGLDEISGGDEQQTKKNIDKISQIISFYKSKSRTFFIKISCRENFFMKYINEILIQQRINISVVKIERKQCDFMNFLLKNLKRDLTSKYVKS